MLADLVRTDRHNHRPVAGDSDLAEAVKVLARAHQSMIWSRRRQANMLRSALREFYPAALAAFDDLTSGDAVEVLRAAPAPALGAALSRPRIAAALRRGGRQRRIDVRAGQIQAALRTPQLAPAPVIAAAMGASVSASVAVIAEMTTPSSATIQYGTAKCRISMASAAFHMTGPPTGPAGLPPGPWAMVPWQSSGRGRPPAKALCWSRLAPPTGLAPTTNWIPGVLRLPKYRAHRIA